MVRPLAKSNVDHDGELTGNHCPAGSTIQAKATVQNFDKVVVSKSSVVMKSSRAVSNIPQSGETGDHSQHGDLTDLAFAAEQARIEARKNHKRYTDAIYARRRRQREKEEENELIREAELAHKTNKKLREENSKLQSMFSGAIAEIEALGDTEKKWLHNVLEKAKATTAPTTKGTDESNDKKQSISIKRQSKHITIKSKPTMQSIAADPPMRSLHRNIEIKSTQVEETSAADADMPQPSNEMSDSTEVASAENKNHRDSNDVPHSTDKHVIEALRQASYRQGLRDAELLHRQRGILAATRNHHQPQQTQPPSVAASRSHRTDVLQSTMLNDTLHQRAIDQLLLTRRINALVGYPDSSVIHPDLSSVLNPRGVTRGGYNPASDLLMPNASMLGYPPDPTLISALARLRNVNDSSISPPSLPSSLTAARMLAIRNSTDSYQLQMQLGLLNAYTDRNHLVTPYLQQQHQLPPEQQISLLAQLRQPEQQLPSPNHRRIFPQGARRD